MRFKTKLSKSVNEIDRYLRNIKSLALISHVRIPISCQFMSYAPNLSH